MNHIDGSMGEGGGQVLRSSLALSIITGQPVTISDIRAGRSRPGLQPQHLAAVEAAAEICAAHIEGAARGSRHLVFHPGVVQPGRYKFDIGTAGSTSLVLQTILLPLSLAESGSTVRVRGGTHVTHSPNFHYLEYQWLPYLRRCGVNARLTLDQAGFYPPGGGQIQAVIQPSGILDGLDLATRGDLRKVHGISAVANLDAEIGKRQKHQALRRLEPYFRPHGFRELKIRDLVLEAPSPGTFLMLQAEFENGQCCFISLGEKGKRAEKVADEAVDELIACLESGGAIDPYLADQLLLPLSIAKSPSRLSTARVTGHLLTNAEVIRQFLPVQIHIHGDLEQPGLVDIFPGT